MYVTTTDLTSIVITVCLSAPLELSRTLMQHDSTLTLWSTLRPRQIFRGLIPTLLRDVPFSGIYWVSYESIKTQLLRLDPTSKNINTSTFLSGALSGILAAGLTTPFDVIKTRIQISEGKVNLREVVGRGRLFSGIGPRVARVAPACAVMIWAYEAVNGWYLERRR
jgi:solute carrier family 25 protein 39/40